MFIIQGNLRYKFSMIDLLPIKIIVYANMSTAFANAIVAITLDNSCFIVQKLYRLSRGHSNVSFQPSCPRYLPENRVPDAFPYLIPGHLKFNGPVVHEAFHSQVDPS